MKTLIPLLVLLLLFTGLTSCLNDENDIATPAPTEETMVDEINPTDPDQPELEAALLKHIHGQMEDFDNAVRETVTRPDGTVETIYMIGGDIELTKDQLTMFRNMSPEQMKQYRTYARVSNNRTIKILGAYGGSEGLTYNQRRGLRFAVANYNALNLGIRLELEFKEKSFWNNLFKDIVVYRAGYHPSASASAGWPSFGNPYKWVRVYDSFNGATDQQAEHVLGHEIGHCLGLRHTDFFNRSYSCGSGGNEGAGSIGAVHIPGTPTGYDAGSVMNACWPWGTNGEFSYYDRVALRWLF